jgi:hypothetical protein
MARGDHRVTPTGDMHRRYQDGSRIPSRPMPPVAGRASKDGGSGADDRVAQIPLPTRQRHDPVAIAVGQP